MLIFSLIQLLLSNSVSLRRDKSILYSRVAITILIFSISIAFKNLYLLFLSRGIGLFGGLFHTTSITNFFHIFIFLISSIILLLTSFYPRKVLGYISPDIVTNTNKNNNLLYKVDYEE
jgi:NADH-ubiquinone oxidoreductase chain 2